MPSNRIATRLIAGALLANAVPHGVHGLRGRPFPTPFSRPPAVGLSSPGTNRAWSAANLAAAAALLRRGVHSRAEAAALGAGALGMGLLLAAWFRGVLPRRR